MNSSSTRRSVAQTSSSSPRTLRRLRSAPRQVHFADSTTEELETMVQNVDSEMTPSNIINLISLSDQETTNNTSNQTNASCKSPSISSSEEENEDSTKINEPSTANPEKQATLKKKEVLAFFDESEDRAGYKCKICQANYKKQDRSTTNLRRHLSSAHNQTNVLYNSQRKNYRDKVPSISVEVKKELDEKLVNAIIVDSRPFGDFSRPGLKSFLATALPNYKPLHRTTIQKRLKRLYKEHRRTLRNILTNVPHVALTSDIWKNNRNRHFISVTAHFYDKKLKLISITLGFRLIRGRHVAERIAKFIKHEITFYNIQNKVRSITSDNAANMLSGVDDLGIGSHQSCMAHNLNLVVKSTVLPLKKKKKSLSSNVSKQSITTDCGSSSKSSTDEDTDVNDYSTSEEEKDECSSFEEDNDGEDEKSSEETSAGEDQSSSSSEDEQNYEITPINVQNDPTLVKIRSLIKQVRGLVGLVHQSLNLSEYVRQQKKQKELPGDGLILDCDIRWNSCYLMLDRFIIYQSIIESITILHRTIIKDLSFSIVQRLKKLIFTEDEWDHLVAVRNVLSAINEACRLLSGKHYQTLSIGYMITCGLHHLLSKKSTSPQARIENVIKKYLFEAFRYHFDEKLSADQKQAMLIAAYLDPHTYRRMINDDRAIAEKLIFDKLDINFSTEQDLDEFSVSTVEYQTVDPLDHFLNECGLNKTTSSSTTISRRRRTAREEIAFYVDRVKGNYSFEQFWNRYKNDLPGMIDLVRSYNMRPATSVPSEGLFSTANYVQRKQRSSLAPKTLKYTMLLRDQNILSDLLQSMN